MSTVGPKRGGGSRERILTFSPSYSGWWTSGGPPGKKWHCSPQRQRACGHSGLDWTGHSCWGSAVLVEGARYSRGEVAGGGPQAMRENVLKVLPATAKQHCKLCVQKLTLPFSTLSLQALLGFCDTNPQHRMTSGTFCVRHDNRQHYSDVRQSTA
ncbi:UNVERIFIED_CONTAM: hypothetical protein FKN15_061043 [Acipenser sinensis]